MASVTGVSIGDRNGDGDTDEPYESGTIYSNTTDGVMLTVTLDKRTVHPASITGWNIWTQAEPGNPSVQPVCWMKVKAKRGQPLKSVGMSPIFDALVGAGDAVMVRAVASNALQNLLNANRMEFSIKLDADVHPVDLEVLALVLDADSITETNADSGGPQGTVVINGYTPQRTHPEMSSLKLMIGDEVLGAADTGVLATAGRNSSVTGEC